MDTTVELPRVLSNERRRKLHLYFSKSVVDKAISFWESVTFMNESKFNIFGPDGGIIVLRKSNEKLSLKNLLPTVIDRGQRIMV